MDVSMKRIEELYRELWIETTKLVEENGHVHAVPDLHQALSFLSQAIYINRPAMPIYGPISIGEPK